MSHNIELNQNNSFSENAEELAYPTIYCGEKRPTNQERTVPVKYSDLVKSELRRSDRRAASNISNIFFKVKKLLIKQLQDKVWLSMRRLQGKGKTYIAKDFKNSANVDHICKLDEGYRIFRTLRGSPPYWEAAKKDIFAMIRQLGLPTFFLSMSAAETRWPELLHSLGKIIDKKNYTAEEVAAMTWETKSRLIRSDPVTTARCFDHRVQRFINDFLKSNMMPLGKIRELVYRVEFQQRGSPHIHGLLWIEDAPKLGIDSNEDVIAFVDKYLTTERHPDFEEGDTLVQMQIHRHSHSCKKNKKVFCRFHFPIPPMMNTMILEPIGPNMTPKQRKRHEDNWTKISEHLNLLDDKVDTSFQQLFHDLEMSAAEYIVAIRSTLKETRMFLKRQPNAIRVNGYNPAVLQAWRANHDIQLVTNAYACAMYIVGYISKGQRGMSDLLRRACKEAKDGGSDIRQQVKMMGNQFSKSVEISAQEAAYLALQMSLRRSTCGFIFINTSPPDERPFMVKSVDELERLPDDSEDVQCSNIISRYIERPVHLEDMCLADFGANYDLVTSNRSRKTKSTKILDLPENDYEENIDDDPYANDDHVLDDDELAEKQKQKKNKDRDVNLIELASGSTMRKRKKKKIIRYVCKTSCQDIVIICVNL